MLIIHQGEKVTLWGHLGSWIFAKQQLLKGQASVYDARILIIGLVTSCNLFFAVIWFDWAHPLIFGCQEGYSTSKKCSGVWTRDIRTPFWLVYTLAISGTSWNHDSQVLMIQGATTIRFFKIKMFLLQYTYWHLCFKQLLESSVLYVQHTSRAI